MNRRRLRAEIKRLEADNERLRSEWENANEGWCARLVADRSRGITLLPTPKEGQKP